MKVESFLTLRCIPESREEMIATFAAQYRAFREEIETKAATGAAIEIPHDTPIRWLLITGRWDAA